MKSYLNILKSILEEGQTQKNRTEIDTLALPNVFWEHNMQEGFPLLTSRYVPWKSLRVELEGFLKGITSKRWYQDRNCRYWDYWANPTEVDRLYDSERNKFPIHGPEFKIKSKKEIQLELDDLGAIYPHQLRKFGQVYGEHDDGVLEGFDQLKYVCDCLENNPENRRIVVNYWNPLQFEVQALFTCHYCWCITVIGNEINLGFDMRSVDMACGFPSNIAHYGLILLILAKQFNLIPNKLTAMLYNCHVYKNHIVGIEEQLSRPLHKLPQVEILGDTNFSILNWKYNDVELKNYHHSGKLYFQVAV